MAAGDRLLDASGNVILDSSGNVILSNGSGDGCCCNSCGGCTGSKPTSITVVISGATACTQCSCFPSCSPGGARAYQTQLTSGSIDGTYDLPFYSGDTTSCVYYANVSCSMTVNVYGPFSDCTTTIVSTLSITNFDISITFLKDFYGPGTHTFQISATATIYDATTGYLFTFALFLYDSQSAGSAFSGLCSDGESTFNNLETPCDSFNGSRIFSDGTATTTFN